MEITIKGDFLTMIVTALNSARIPNTIPNATSEFMQKAPIVMPIISAMALSTMGR